MVDYLTHSVFRWVGQRRTRKHQEIVYRVIRELHSLTVTVHGRQLLRAIYTNPDNGVEPEIKRMYYILSVNAPLQEWSEWN